MNATSAWCGMIVDRAGLRRQRIIEAARNLFVHNGFHATGVAQIAKASGVAVGQIYRDFEAKENIVAAIVERDCVRLLERESLRRAVAGEDMDAVWNWMRQFIRPAADRGALLMFAEIIAEATRNERIAAIFARTRGEVRVNLLTALALLAPGEHVAAERELLAELLLMQSLGLMQQMLLQPKMDIDPLVDAIMSAVTREVGAMNAVAAAHTDPRIPRESREPAI